MSSTAKNGPSQTFLNLGFNEGQFNKGVREGRSSQAKADSRSTRYSKPFEEPSTAISRPNGHTYSETVAKYLGTQPASATKAFNTIQSGVALTKSLAPMSPQNSSINKHTPIKSPLNPGAKALYLNTQISEEINTAQALSPTIRTSGMPFSQNFKSIQKSKNLDKIGKFNVIQDMNYTPKKTQKTLALNRLAQTLTVADQYPEYTQAQRESSMLANPSYDGPHGIDENSEMYRTMNFIKPSKFSP